uniref:Peroxisomal ATPase PEX1 n=1 Tax=Caenorhabditis japonica TaxID=281687 RepID=A0A8R1DKR6_CAEJA
MPRPRDRRYRILGKNDDLTLMEWGGGKDGRPFCRGHCVLFKVDDRRELFETYLDNRFAKQILTTIVQKSDGYTFNEIEKLATSLSVECAIRGSQVVEQCDVEKAFECFVAGKIGKVEDDQVLPTMTDVGGMFEQKKLLEQVIIWPKKYPQLFESVGVPVSKGILLHGPSGCGKTLLANAIISNSKFSVVNVKGPELLSKYIGASEENVRLVFEKARSCAPSILFFDELDSLAPKRGHDSTGVTDRLVNQLLTELDGAEGGMKGVIILGCTSRIDLIDDALLRPGRFDQHVFCGHPNQIERLDIIKVLTKNLRTTDVNFESIAKRTENWNGADLQLLFTNAQFYNARKITEGDDGLEEDDVAIDSEAIERVFADSRPKAKKSEVDTRVGQKVTLA